MLQKIWEFKSVCKSKPELEKTLQKQRYQCEMRDPLSLVCCFGPGPASGELQNGGVQGGDGVRPGSGGAPEGLAVDGLDLVEIAGGGAGGISAWI